MRPSAPPRSAVRPPRTPRSGTSWSAATEGGAELFLGSLEVGVRARRVIRDVHDAAHLRRRLSEQPLDALPQRDDGILYVDQLHTAAMTRDHRIDLLLEHLRHLLIQRVIIDGVRETRRRREGG